MHEKLIIECSNCFSTNVLTNKHRCKCLDCNETFLKSDKTRAFICSSYEKEFEDTYIMQYRGYNIYSYINIMDEEKFTFWYSSEECEYYSSKNTLEDCYVLIDDIIKNKGN